MNEELKRQYLIAEAEEAFVEAKTTHGRDSEEAKAAKARMEELRRPYREQRAAAQAEVADGDAVAAPDTINATAG